MNLRDWSPWCHHCDELRRFCRCAEVIEAERTAHRTARLLRAIDLVEIQIENLWCENENHTALPELKEKHKNLTASLVINRKVA